MGEWPSGKSFLTMARSRPFSKSRAITNWCTICVPVDRKACLIAKRTFRVSDPRSNRANTSGGCRRLFNGRFISGLWVPWTCNDASRGRRKRGSHGGHGTTEDVHPRIPLINRLMPVLSRVSAKLNYSVTTVTSVRALLLSEPRPLCERGFAQPRSYLSLICQVYALSGR